MRAFLRFGAAVLTLQASLAQDFSTDDLAKKAPDPIVNQTNCVNRQYTYQRLAGYGFVANDARDKYGDTLGGFGSSIAIDRRSWKKSNKGVYTGTLWALPDRGWYDHDPLRN